MILGLGDLTAIFSILLTLITLLGGVVWRLVDRIRTNDLKHVDLKIDALHDDVKQTNATLQSHIQWHLEHPQSPRGSC